MTVLATYNMVVLTILTIMSFALTLLSLSMSESRPVNRYFSYLTASIGLWGIFSLLLLSILTIRASHPDLAGFGNPVLFLELSVISLGILLPLLLIFVNEYIEYRAKWIEIISFFNLMFLLLASVPIFQHKMMVNPHLHQNGLVIVDFTPAAKMIIYWSVLMMVLSIYLFRQTYHKRGDRFFLMGMTIFVAGFAVRMIANFSAPIMTTTTLISIIMLGYPMIRRQILHPLQEKTKLLQDEIHQRESIEFKLRESEEHYRTVVENLPIGLVIHQNGMIKWANPYIKNIFRTDQPGSRKRISDFILDYLPPEEVEYFRERLAEVARTGIPAPLAESHMKLPDGKYLDIESMAVPIHLEDSSAILMIIMDITARKEAAIAVATERERLQTTLRSIGDGVIATDIKGNILLMNKVSESLTGWSEKEAIGKPLSEVMVIVNKDTNQVELSPLTQVINTGGLILLESDTMLVSKNGERRMIADSAAPIFDMNSKIDGVVIVFRDVTDEKIKEDALLRAQKIESIGILAGGIAHDFNNILTAILGNISLAVMMSEQDSQIVKILGESEKAAIRARDLTSQLLTFSKGGAPVIQSASVTDLIRESADFTINRSNVAIRYEFEENIWPAAIDRGQIGQVIQNIVINAVQAMPDGGVINIRAKKRYLTADSHIPLNPGRYIMVSISDTGGGVPEKYLKMIFDPYFSTKQKGHGLGLAIVYSIIRKHEGWINVTSEAGRGTTFTIYLPPASSPAVPQDQMEAIPEISGAKILIMDDEEIVRNITFEILENLGCKVLLAEDGEAALKLYRDEAGRGKSPDLVNMDLTIPGGMGGREAIKKLLVLDPAARAIVSSGYSNDPVMAHFSDYGFVDVIENHIVLMN